MTTNPSDNVPEAPYTGTPAQAAGWLKVVWAVMCPGTPVLRELCPVTSLPLWLVATPAWAHACTVFVRVSLADSQRFYLWWFSPRRKG